MAKISVIIPIYNVEKYLIECMQSLINQTFTDIEIICVDDASTDNSIKIVQAFAKQDKRIKIITHKQNSGVAIARNSGLDASTSPYIMFCDPDDYYAPNMCEKLYTAITENNTDMAMCGVHVIYEADEHMRHSDNKTFAIPDAVLSTKSNLLLSLHMGVPYRIFRRDIITEHNIRFPVGLKYEDLYFTNVYYLWAKNVTCISDRLYNYRRRGGSIMNTSYAGQTNASLDFIRVAIEYYQYLLQHNKLSEYEHYFWKTLFINSVRNAIQFAAHQQFRDEIFDLCSEFIDKNYKFGRYGLQTDYIIKLIHNRGFSVRKRYLFRTISVFNNGIKHDVSLFGIISIYKKKHINNQTKYYLFGIPVFTA